MASGHVEEVVLVLDEMDDWDDVGECVNGEVVEELGREDEDESSCISGSKYFINVIRCQPGISCCGRSGCRIPLQ